MHFAQLRAARALLGWTQEVLGEKAGVHRNTIRQVELGRRVDIDTINRLRRALESAGVEFTNGKRPGVRMNKG